MPDPKKNFGRSFGRPSGGPPKPIPGGSKLPPGKFPPPKPKPKPPPKPEPVTFKCGCVHYPKELANIECGKCARKNRIHRKRKKYREREKKIEETIKERLGEGKTSFRLPAGSEKHIIWTGSGWHGKLTVPGCPEPFEAVAFEEKDVVRYLHDHYVAWFVENKLKSEPTDGGSDREEGRQCGAEGVDRNASVEGSTGTNSGEVGSGNDAFPPRKLDGELGG